jgi:hypothetical protein
VLDIRLELLRRHVLESGHLKEIIRTMSAEGIRVDFDRAKAEAFAGRLLAALNDGALCVMASVGHRTGCSTS